MSAQVFEKTRGECGNISKPERAGKLPDVFDRFENIRRRFFAKSGEFGHGAAFAGALELGDRVDAQSIPEDFDFFCS